MNIADKLKKLNQPQEVSFNNLFDENFMKKYTNFKTINELLLKCNITNSEELEKNIALLESEIKTNTKFSSWEEMKDIAGKELICKQIKKF